MKELVKTLVKSPAAFVILILIMILVLLITLRAADVGNEGVSTDNVVSPTTAIYRPLHA